MPSSRAQVLRDTTISRLVFYQQTSETYSYRATHERFVWGASGAPTTSLNQSCFISGGGTSLRGSGQLYASDGDGLPFRMAMNGSAPWWFAFEGNTDTETGDMVVGDRGLIVRGFSARLGGAEQPSPSLSILCDKIELGTPAGLTALDAGDYINMSLEVIVLPRMGDEYDKALRNTYNARGTSPERLTLRDNLYGMSSSERVRTQALGGEIVVSALIGAHVERHYPVRVLATGGDEAMFEVRARNASDLVAAMGDWCVGHVKADDRWCCASSCGTCGKRGRGSNGQANPPTFTPTLSCNRNRALAQVVMAARAKARPTHAAHLLTTRHRA